MNSGLERLANTSLEHRQGCFGDERDAVLYLASVDIL